ncbi:MAG: hypothetical protein JXR86_03010 [Spirochaetales bacterium]|nr:hypothetical protein [Spirochaetales bacterium]
MKIGYSLYPSGEMERPEAFIFGGINYGEIDVEVQINPFGRGEEIEIRFQRNYIMYVIDSEAEFHGNLKIACRDGFGHAVLITEAALPTLPEYKNERISKKTE